MRSESFEFSEVSGFRPFKRQIRWPKRRIEVALSNSLLAPGTNFKAGSDVVTAVRRALAQWSSLTNITFVETMSNVQSVSSGSGDGISLITIADTRENNAVFDSSEMTGRTRVFYDPETGEINEADICINPHPALEDGTPIQFSTDGTPGTYDLQSTVTHEIGHLLGLDHSSVMAATMQARQGINGVFGLPALTGRTLSEEDRERARSLYGSAEEVGALEGKVASSFSGSQVWAEESVTGRISGTARVATDGSYRIDSLAPGPYRVLLEQLGNDSKTDRVLASGSGRVLRAVELATRILVNPKATSQTISSHNAVHGPSLYLNPQFIGLNGELSTVALPLEAGKTFTVYLGGEGLDQVSGSSITVNSPFFSVDQSSFKHEQFGTSFPVVSVALSVASNTPFGDYTIRLQSGSGEMAYLAGGITIDPGVNSLTANPTDDARFFVSQHYRDFLGREPDRDGLEYWATQLERCGADLNCRRERRLAVSAAFFAEGEFQETGSFVYDLYKAGLGRRPTFAEFTSDRSNLIGSDKDREARRASLAENFVRRREFQQKYPDSMKAAAFVDAVLADILQNSGVNLSFERNNLMTVYDGTDSGRAKIISRVATRPAFVQTEYPRAFVLMQYFGYLRRDPDETGYSFWLNLLLDRPGNDPDAFTGTVCAFLNSNEYQSRFGMAITHTGSDCK